MNQKLDVALRVMTAIRERTNPLRSDLKSLQTWTDSTNRNASSYDLACMVISAELQRMKSVSGGAVA